MPPQKVGAAELHAYYLANQLARLGNEVHFVTSANHNASFVPKLILHRLPDLTSSLKQGYSEAMINYATGGILAFLRASAAIKGNRYDVIHGHGNVSTALLLPLSKKFKSIFTVHNYTPWMLTPSSSINQAVHIVSFRTFDLRIIKNVDCLIAVNEYLKSEILNRFRVETKRIRVIPNGVDTKLFTPIVAGSTSIRKKYGIDDEYSLFVGRLVEQKGVHFLIEAIAGTRLHAVIVGDGPLLSSLRSLSRRLRVERQVHFVGAIPWASDELPKFYAEAETFVIPTLGEGLPMVGLEAMASGLPLVGADIFGTGKMIKHGCNGFRIKVGDTSQLRERLVQLSEDGSLRKTMGAHSREMAETLYSWEHVAEQTLKLYNTLEPK